MKATKSANIENFGTKLIELRKDANFSQEQLAKLAGCSQSHISHLETGVRRVTERQIRNLAGALDIRPSTLYRAAEMHVMQFELPKRKIGRPKDIDRLHKFTVQGTEEQIRSMEIFWDFLRYSKVQMNQRSE